MASHDTMFMAPRRGASTDPERRISTLLMEHARGRLAIVAALLAVVSLVALVAVVLNLSFLPEEMRVALPRSLPMLATQLIVSVVVAVLSRREKIPVRYVLFVGLMYQLYVSWVSAFGATEIMLQRFGTVPQVTFVEVLIVFFPLLIPNPPRYVLLASMLAGATRPVAALAASHHLGIELPDEWVMATLLPPILTALLATVAARVVYGLGREASRAKEMGSYQLETKLGEGGMGEVWRASHKMLARPAAVKFIRPEVLGERAKDSSGAMERFGREAQATAKLSSPHTVKLFDFGRSHDGTFYYVMELLEGINLAELVSKYGSIEPRRAVFILRQVCNSLAEAHVTGLVHRDIKPANVLVCRYGLQYDFVKVVDFGLVAATTKDNAEDKMLTATNTVVGTPAFMAPEAIKSPDIDHRVDIYAVGCLIYWLVAGRLVFEEDSAMALAVAHATQTPRPLSELVEVDLPDGLEDVALACLAKNARERPTTAVELDHLLREVQLGAEWQEEDAQSWWLHHAPLASHGEVTWTENA